ncbi:hypothetical protein PG999_009952 [Apiospora kogelbergensis]|uniref:Uncharacterized protein n=1 Tax=Apiospora kogelbergensis TaxID=1337665 RepID=A0AAW0QMI8_9PEZI
MKFQIIVALLSVAMPSLAAAHPRSISDSHDDHPMGAAEVAVQRERGTSPPTGRAELEKRACWYGAAVGCTKGYCWKKCDGQGSWCWTAGLASGQGPWITCNADRDCNAAMACGAAVAGQACANCGCDCRDKPN